MAVYPDFFSRCLISHDAAMKRVVRSHARLGAGFATNEPHSFYASLYDEIRSRDLTDITMAQGLFLSPYPFLFGDAMGSKGLLADIAKDGHGVLGSLAKRINGPTRKLEGLRKLVRHYDEMVARRFRVVSPFIGPTNSTVIPDTPLIRSLFPAYAGRNSTRVGFTDMQVIHFPFALEAICYSASGEARLDTFITVMTPPNAQGEMSLGPAAGVNAELTRLLIERADMDVLLYLNPRYPFTRGHGDAPNSFPAEAFRKLAEKGRLMIVENDTAEIPCMPAGSFAHPSKAEREIAAHVVNHIELHPDLCMGRAIQVGIGQTGVQAIRALKNSSWEGRQYSEMLEPFTYDLFEAGKIKGSHFIEKNGTRTPLDGKLVGTFTMAEAGSDFYAKLDNNPAIVLAEAARVVIPEGFVGGLGINNALAIDFQGQINSASRDQNAFSGIGGLGMITRGLARGGIGYFCLKSTHRTPEGKRRSSIFPFLPPGSAVSVTGPDTCAGRDGARFFLVTEFGVTPLNGVCQSELIRNLISVAHPDHRDWLKSQAWEHYRVRV